MQSRKKTVVINPRTYQSFVGPQHTQFHSVRKGLEEERAALRGLIRAVGHTPVLFEDFSAQTTPSRQACLDALDSADVCIFLLGPSYGHVFPETGQSATHDEWVAAKTAGKPRWVYRKLGVTFENAQQDFLDQVGTSLADRIRRAGVVKNSAALTSSSSREHAIVGISVAQPRFDAPQHGELVEVRLHKSGQVSLRATLPRDNMGSILDQDALSQQVTSLLRFSGALDLIHNERIVVAIGVSNPQMTQVDRFNPHQSRTRAYLSAC
ncbi:DUF4062 domain-containing protein [Streptomyces sp. DSM 40868]|nr:DUF4062 domain-containing protein [Streptomyces sp. DSM 40868]